MFTTRRWLIALMPLSLCTLVWPAAAGPIASVNEVVNSAQREPPGATKLPVRLSDELVQDEHVQTFPRSAVKLIFIDGSEMRLDESSEVVLSQYVFDPGSQTSNALLQLGAGVFRFVSGGKKDEGVVLQTPAATIGIRGTDILVTVSATGATKVQVIEGAVILQPTGTGLGASVTAGQIGTVAGPNTNASVSHAGSGPSDTDSTRNRAERGDPGDGRSGRSASAGNSNSGGNSGGGAGGNSGGNPGGGSGGNSGGDSGGDSGGETGGSHGSGSVGHGGAKGSVSGPGGSASGSVGHGGAKGSVSGPGGSASGSVGPDGAKGSVSGGGVSASGSIGRGGISGSVGGLHGSIGGRNGGNGGKSGGPSGGKSH